MTFEQFAAIARDWTNRLTPDEARLAAQSLRRQIYIPDLPDKVSLDAVLAAIAKGGPARGVSPMQPRQSVPCVA